MNDDAKTQARILAREVVSEIFERLGLDVDTATSREQIRRDLMWLRKARKGADDVHVWVRRSAIGVFVSALLYVVWSGIKMAFIAKTGSP